MSVISRFAPSPTGYLHIGGARTALFSWLFARKHKGKFILRIEDTDRERSTKASVQAILDGMAWLGLDCNEGPIYQTTRFDRYKEVIEQLLAEGKAYKCYCSKERLDKLREQQMQAKQKPRYDGCCRNLEEQQDGPFVVRFKNPQQGIVEFVDLVRGKIAVSNEELDDLIIARSDGSPTYNFTVVVDDSDMGVTHVIRGADHINNTPRQINIFTALGKPAPVYGHVPMIHGEDGKKLSKRHGAVSVMQYREDGYLPQAVLNYLVRLGWSHGDQEVFSVAEMIELFDVGHISKSPAIFSVEKLLWLNQYYIKSLPTDELIACLQYYIAQAGIDVNDGPELAAVLEPLRERAKTLWDLVEGGRYFYQDITLDEKAAQKHLKLATVDPLKQVLQGFEQIEDWKAEPLHHVITTVAESLEMKMGKVAQPIRVAVTGNTMSPPMGVTLELIGRERVLARIERAINYCQQSVN